MTWNVMEVERNVDVLVSREQAAELHQAMVNYAQADVELVALGTLAFRHGVPIFTEQQQPVLRRDE